MPNSLLPAVRSAFPACFCSSSWRKSSPEGSKLLTGCTRFNLPPSSASRKISYIAVGRGQLAEPAPSQGNALLVNIHEAGPLEGRLVQWPVLATAGALEVRLAGTEAEVEQAQRLRYHVFYEEMDAVPSVQMRVERRDFDKYDDVCDHLLVVDRNAHGDDGQPLVVGTYRLTRDVDAARAGG